MEIDGVPYTPADTLDARRRGVAMIYQELSLAPHLSVWENIVLGAEPHRFGWLDRAASRQRARGVLARLAHEHLDLDRPVGEFSIAEQQVIEIARALLAEPRVLVMDEPTSSLTQADTEKLFDVVAQLSAHGVSVIYISHFLEEVRRVAAALHRAQGRADGRCRRSGGDRPDGNRAPDGGREMSDLYPRTRAAIWRSDVCAAGRRAGGAGRGDPRASPD
jgi:ribose transport system ATP-binding protein